MIFLGADDGRSCLEAASLTLHRSDQASGRDLCRSHSTVAAFLTFQFSLCFKVSADCGTSESRRHSNIRLAKISLSTSDYRRVICHKNDFKLSPFTFKTKEKCWWVMCFIVPSVKAGVSSPSFLHTAECRYLSRLWVVCEPHVI